MLGRNGKMQPEFVDFPNSPIVLVLLIGRLFLRSRSFRKPTRWDFVGLRHRDGQAKSKFTENTYLGLIFST